MYYFQPNTASAADAATFYGNYRYNAALDVVITGDHMTLLNFRLLITFVLCVWAGLANADTSEAVIPTAVDLNQDAEEAARRHLPILVMFSAESCAYCRLVEDDFLKPMIYSGDYSNKVIIRRVTIDSNADMRDFHGKHMTTDAFASQQKVSLTPTLKLYDADGHELVPNIVGINTVDFYGGYLDDAINKSLSIIQHRIGTKNYNKVAVR